MELQFDKISLAFQEKISAEMTAKEQLELLNIEIEDMMEPILDIGCGKHGNLVNYFTNLRLHAYGIDKQHKETRNIMCADWFEINFGIENWGTIICNLTFSRHFLNSYQKENELKYTAAYIKILESLYVGGAWYYTPSVPFIEELLDQSCYKVEYCQVHNNIKRTKVSRLK